MDKVLLTYGSCCIKSSDISTLDDYQYLNDLIISFYYEILTKKYPCNDIILIEPAVSMSIIVEEDLSIVDECIFTPLKVKEKKFVFLPINDNERIEYKTNGSHWALSVIDVENSLYYYFDSMLSQIKNSKKSMKKCEKLFKKKFHFVSGLETKFQNNSFDCGMYVLAFTEELMKYIISKGASKECLNEIDFDKFFSESERVKGNFSNFRKEIKDIIYKLIEEKNKK